MPSDLKRSEAQKLLEEIAVEVDVVYQLIISFNDLGFLQKIS